jgi:hypothetical protein
MKPLRRPGSEECAPPRRPCCLWLRGSFPWMGSGPTPARKALHCLQPHAASQQAALDRGSQDVALRVQDIDFDVRVERHQVGNFPALPWLATPASRVKRAGRKVLLAEVPGQAGGEVAIEVLAHLGVVEPRRAQKQRQQQCAPDRPSSNRSTSDRRVCKLFSI